MDLEILFRHNISFTEFGPGDPFLKKFNLDGWMGYQFLDIKKGDVFLLFLGFIKINHGLVAGSRERVGKDCMRIFQHNVEILFVRGGRKRSIPSRMDAIYFLCTQVGHDVI
jgi:hypothetical protein